MSTKPRTREFFPRMKDRARARRVRKHRSRLAMVEWLVGFATFGANYERTVAMAASAEARLKEFAELTVRRIYE